MVRIEAVCAEGVVAVKDNGVNEGDVADRTHEICIVFSHVLQCAEVNGRSSGLVLLDLRDIGGVEVRVGAGLRVDRRSRRGESWM